MADLGEFDDLYRRESEGVLVFFTRRTFDPEIALDLTAETFAQAYVGWRRVRGRSREERQAWLYTIAPGSCRAIYGEHPPARLVCFQVGIRRGASLFEPRSGASPRPLEGTPQVLPTDANHMFLAGPEKARPKEPLPRSPHHRYSGAHWKATRSSPRAQNPMWCR